MDTPIYNLLPKLRLRARDMQKTGVSDYEALAALNDAKTMLWIALAESASSIPRKSVTLDLIDGVAALPGDFYSLVYIQPGVYVDGFVVRGGYASAELEYNSIPVQADAHYVFTDDEEAILDDEPLVPIPYSNGVPPAIALDTVEVARYILSGDTDGAAQTAQATARRLCQKREYGAIPDWKALP
ncbi:hypothetical protein FACS1894204_06190 [Synergistales bacterium]|nr:hypothetical protein FACS1894204_06190 [Synergistales bacterium]